MIHPDTGPYRYDGRIKILTGNIHHPLLCGLAASSQTGNTPVILHPENNDASLKIQQRGHLDGKFLWTDVITLELNARVFTILDTLDKSCPVHQSESIFPAPPLECFATALKHFFHKRALMESRLIRYLPWRFWPAHSPLLLQRTIQ